MAISFENLTLGTNGGSWSFFDHEPRSNRGLKNCSVVVVELLVLFQYFFN